MKKILWLLAIATLSISSVFAQAKFIDGTDYHTLKQSIGVKQPGTPEVAEFFWYGCPHCYALEPILNKWVATKKPANATFYRIPAAGGSWTFAAQAQYTADKLGLDKTKFHKEYLDEYHVRRNGGALMDKDKFFEFLSGTFNVSKDKADAAWNSFEVKKNLESAENKAKIANINGVPSFVVNGKYLVDVADARSEERLFEIITFLLEDTKSE